METLLLFIYFLVVFYVLYQMALDLERQQEDRVFIHVDPDFLGNQTQSQLDCQPDAKHIKASGEEMSFGKIKQTALKLAVKSANPRAVLSTPDAIELKEMGLSEEGILAIMAENISIRVSPTGRQKLRPISFLSVYVENSTSDMQVYINWDHSSLEMFGAGNRIIRSTPNMPRDLTQPQIFSLVNPGQNISANVTTEQNYFNNPETDRMELADNLVNLKERVEFSDMPDPTGDDSSIQPLYTLDLMIGLKHVTQSKTELLNLLVPFKFTLEISPDKIALPPLRWILRRVGKRNRPERNWFWGQ
ncbi:MAG: hypothetical protein AAFO84_11525 [Cyanobacteria bacterium J06598_1]